MLAHLLGHDPAMRRAKVRYTPLGSAVVDVHCTAASHAIETQLHMKVRKCSPQVHPNLLQTYDPREVLFLFMSIFFEKLFMSILTLETLSPLIFVSVLIN